MTHARWLSLSKPSFSIPCCYCVSNRNFVKTSVFYVTSPAQRLHRYQTALLWICVKLPSQRRYRDYPQRRQQQRTE